MTLQLPRILRSVAAAVLASAALVAAPGASAGLLEDDEARKAILDLRQRVEAQRVANAEELRRLNDELAAQNPRAMFVTMVCLDARRSGRVTCANAGHDTSLLVGSAAPRAVFPAVLSPPLGIWEPAMTTEFLVTSLVVILLPGTGVIYTLALGIGGGFRAGLLAAFGCTLGIIPHILASVVGLAALLHASALAFEVLRYIGVAYLLFIAWSLLRESNALDLDPHEAPAEKALRIVRKGILTNIFNPKLSLFFLAFLPQFVPASATGAAVSSELEQAGIGAVRKVDVET